MTANVKCIGENVCYIPLHNLKCAELRGHEKDSILSGEYCPQWQKGEITGKVLLLDAIYKTIEELSFQKSCCSTVSHFCYIYAVELHYISLHYNSWDIPVYKWFAYLGVTEAKKRVYFTNRIPD